MGHHSDLAFPRGTSPAEHTRFLHSVHDEFVGSGSADPAVRSMVLESWRRSMLVGIDPENALAPIEWGDADLADARELHPLAPGMPIIRRLLVESAEEAGMLVAVSDASGRLLWVEGSSSLRSAAEGMHFVPGADWSEASAGTNAPGTALALDRPVQIFGPEHLARNVTSWSCSAVPIHDPDTGAILGVLDLTGDDEVVRPQSLALVRATVAAVEAELRLRRLQPRRWPSAASTPPMGPLLDVLGGHGATWHHGSTVSRLSLRHSELLLLLSEAADGMTSAELTAALSVDRARDVTVRAELSRLRRVLGTVTLESRPYRVRGGLDTDLAHLRAHVAGGRLRQAVAVYRGPVLPQSTAPAVERIRDETHMFLRSSLLAGDDPDALLSFADSPHGCDDLEVWERALAVLAPSSPRRAQTAARVAHLAGEIGLPVTPRP